MNEKAKVIKKQIEKSRAEMLKEGLVGAIIAKLAQ